MATTTNTTPPAANFKDGLLNVAVWKRQNGENTYYDVTFSRSYKQDDEWKKTQVIPSSDILKLQRLLTKAYDFVAENG